MIAFDLKHIPGNIFVNDLISPLSDMAGFFLCIFVQKYTSTKITYVSCFALTFVFGAGLIFLKLDWEVPILIVFAKIGISGCYSISYYMMTEYFPPLFLSFAFGITQFASRAFTILAFPVSEIDAPTPMIIFSVTPWIAFVLLILFVKPPRKDRL